MKRFVIVISALLLSSCPPIFAGIDWSKDDDFPNMIMFFGWKTELISAAIAVVLFLIQLAIYKGSDPSSDDSTDYFGCLLSALVVIFGIGGWWVFFPFYLIYNVFIKDRKK